MSELRRRRHLRAEEQLAETLTDYQGRWVAVHRHVVIADAASLEELLKLIGGRRCEGVFQVAAGPLFAVARCAG